MHFANRFCRKVQQKYTSNFPLSTETAVLKYLEGWSHVLFSLFNYYWLPIQVFPISTSKMKANSSSAIWSSFVFSQMLLFKAYHTAWWKAVSWNSSPRCQGCNFSCLPQIGMTSLIGRKMNVFALKALMFLNLARKTLWTYLLSAKHQIIWTWTCSHAAEEYALLAGSKIIKEREASPFFHALYLLHLINPN